MPKTEQVTDPINRSQELETALTNLAEAKKVEVEVVDPGETVPPLNSPNLENIAQAIRPYVEAPTIRDHFGANHVERRNFYQMIETADPRLNQWYQTNRLRYNNLLSLGYLYPAFQKIFDTLPAAKKVVTALTEAIPDASTYNAMKTEERIDLTQTIAKSLKQIVRELQKIDH